MKKHFFTLLAMPLALAGNGAAQAQNAAPKARTIYLYNSSLGTAPASINAAKSGPWGNGTVAPSRRVDYEGAPVLEVVTRNFQEGVRFDFTTPVNLDAYRDSGFLRLRLRFRSGGGGGGGFPGGGFRGGSSGSSGSGSSSGSSGGSSNFGDFGGGANFQLRPRLNENAQFGGALPQFGSGSSGSSRSSGSSGSSRDGGFGEEAMAPQQTTNIKEIAVTLLRENGVTTGRIPVDLKKTVADDEGWRLFVLPIKNMTSTPGASGAVTRAIFTSDTEDTIYMAQAALVIESGEMTVSIRRPEDVAGAQIAEIEAKPGSISLIADVEAGAADPIVEWNFDADSVGNLPPGALSSPPEDFDGSSGSSSSSGSSGRSSGSSGRSSGSSGRSSGSSSLGGPGTVEMGPRIDARGITATFEYPNEEQNYRVEVTVTDRGGTKTPVKASILVKVRG